MKILEGVYLITGATGLIGSLLINTLLEQSDCLKRDIKVIGVVRDVQKAEKIYQNYNSNNLRFVCTDIINFNQNIENYMLGLEDETWIPDYIFHCASVTKSADMITNPVETGDGIILGTRNILQFAVDHPIKSIVYLSSMEVYGVMKNSHKLVTENMLGDIELFNARSCYPLGKRVAEHYCYLFYKEYGIPVKIARLSQTFGKGILPGENRVFAQFAKAVLENQDIVLHTFGNSMGNYCDSLDTVRALFLLLEKGENGEAYNIVNEENTMRIRDMAELVADKVAKKKIQVVYEIPKENIHGFASETELRLSSAKIKKLGWSPIKKLEEMYLDMIEEMKER